ncbi:MAG: hypothetical protein Tsb002_27940 [Wenzhouxiangellaceae bacterium]
MKNRESIKALINSEHRDINNQAIDIAAGAVDLNDETLQNISGGCVLSTPNTSCVPPGVYCP